eukprot:gnl/MRDRNA2_/MRDRNA2_51592_c0_seq1.p1 gnl/MRDRNA2_/MRDRNA2_51592_c0~~gnl/MRDRNA2_/MRDRNA2_51592_c0_seq1.p1  ORF type:complete len:275 (-),score=109.87 gnl/MRDRNA2_/MRDRNA2_51592_c0_seq1:49-873(-)
MARNEEKTLAALNRWTKQKQDLEDGDFAKGQKRYKLSFEIDNVKDCEKFRMNSLKEVTKMIGEIQNAGLGEHRIRDMNDEINRLLREKGHWEDRIKELGGVDYKGKQQQQALEADGAELAGQKGYKYFGAAKDLPGVRDLFEAEEAPEAPRKTRAQLFKNIQPDYYGWRDEEDGMLVLAEQSREIELVQKEVDKWEAGQKRKKMEEEIEAEEAAEAAAKKKAREAMEKARTDFKAFVDIPTMDEIEKLILKKKKDALLAKYGHKEADKDLKVSS